MKRTERRYVQNIEKLRDIHWWACEQKHAYRKENQSLADEAMCDLHVFVDEVIGKMEDAQKQYQQTPPPSKRSTP